MSIAEALALLATGILGGIASTVASVARMRVHSSPSLGAAGVENAETMPKLMVGGAASTETAALDRCSRA